MLKLFSRPTKELTLVSLVVGVFGVMFLAVLPIIGALVLVGVLVLAIGAMIETLTHSTLK
jgi:hypothetical protein